MLSNPTTAVPANPRRVSAFRAPHAAAIMMTPAIVQRMPTIVYAPAWSLATVMATKAPDHSVAQVRVSAARRNGEICNAVGLSGADLEVRGQY